MGTDSTISMRLVYADGPINYIIQFRIGKLEYLILQPYCVGINKVLNNSESLTSDDKDSGRLMVKYLH